MMFGKILILLFAFILAISAERVRYDNYEVYSVTPRSVEELKLLHLTHKSTNDFKFWNEPAKIDLPVLVMVPPHSAKLFKNFVDGNGLEAKMTISNVQELIDEEQKVVAKNSEEDWTSYLNLDEINNWLNVQEANTNFKVKRIELGSSYLGKTIYALSITKAGVEDDASPGVILEAGIHAREWISPAASSYVVNEILNSPADSIWREFQYLYIPTINPDGYEYTWTTDRMWRKNRRPFLAGLCYGVDINRNWDTHWMSTGASNDPCAEDFAGYKANSEVETQSIADRFQDLNEANPKRYDIYISFHSFSQLMMYPWGWSGEPTPLSDLWNKTAQAAVEALKNSSGTEFEYGNIHDTIYPASGSSIEYYYDKYNSTFTFTFELRDRGHYGFLLPPHLIVPSGIELKDALESILNSYKALLPPPPGE